MIKKVTSLLLVSMVLLTFTPQKSYAFGEPVYDATNHIEALATKLHIIEMYKMEWQKLQETIESIKNANKLFDIFSSNSHSLGHEIPTSGSDKIGQYR